MYNKKICIIAANNIRYSPYINYYKRILDKNGLDYELIYPDRHNLGTEWDNNCIKKSWVSNLPAAINYFVFACKVKSEINKNNYNKLILLTSQIAVYLSTWVKSRYRNNYLVDIRDYSHENNSLYYHLEKKALESAGCRVISSEKFKCFLPEGEYYICHNFNEEQNVNVKPWRNRKCPIIIGFVGTLGYEDQVKKLIELIKTDNRYCFYVYGGDEKERPEIPQAIANANCERIKFFGPYLPSEKQKIINEVDILYNVYGNDSMLLTSALSNKLYDCMINHKLILNSMGTYMEEMSGVCGFSIDWESQSPLDDLYEWFLNVDENEVLRYQESMLNRFVEENRLTEAAIEEFIKE